MIYFGIRFKFTLESPLELKLVYKNVYLVFIEHLLSTRYYAKCFVYIYILNPDNKPILLVLSHCTHEETVTQSVKLFVQDSKSSS